MKKVLVINLIVVLLIVALTATATWAYFSSSASRSATISTANIAIGQTWKFPLVYEKMIPDMWQAKEVAIENGSNVAADFYLQMLPDENSGEVNFCYAEKGKVLDIKIEEISGWDGTVVKTWYSGSICDLYPVADGARIAKIGDEIGPKGIRYFRLNLYLKPAADNTYMNKTNQDIVHLIAVQSNGPAPAVVNPQYPDWPVWPEGDPNY
jgi:predicted ribosomally synthesized peptide with SipW-like signal peptide